MKTNIVTYNVKGNLSYKNVCINDKTFFLFLKGERTIKIRG